MNDTNGRTAFIILIAFAILLGSMIGLSYYNSQDSWRQSCTNKSTPELLYYPFGNECKVMDRAR